MKTILRLLSEQAKKGEGLLNIEFKDLNVDIEMQNTIYEAQQVFCLISSIAKHLEESEKDNPLDGTALDFVTLGWDALSDYGYHHGHYLDGVVCYIRDALEEKPT